MKNFEITHLNGERGRVRLAGELDLHSVPELKEALANLHTMGPVKLDLSELTFVDSSGLHAFVEFAGAENGNGPVILEAVPASMVRLFEISRLSEHPRLEIRVGSDGR